MGNPFCGQSTNISKSSVADSILSSVLILNSQRSFWCPWKPWSFQMVSFPNIQEAGMVVEVPVELSYEPLIKKIKVLWTPSFSVSCHAVSGRYAYMYLKHFCIAHLPSEKEGLELSSLYFSSFVLLFYVFWLPLFVKFAFI